MATLVFFLKKMSGLLVNTNFIDGKCDTLLGHKHNGDHFLIALPLNAKYIPKDVAMTTNSLQSIATQIHPETHNTLITPISFQQSSNLFQVILYQQNELQHPPQCVAMAPNLITTQILPPLATNSTSTAIPTPINNTQQCSQPGTCNSPDASSQMPLESLVERARTQAEEFVVQLNDIVSSSVSMCEHGALNPQEVMDFYETLPDDKKVRKSKRNKYRKYSLASEFEVFKKSQEL